MEKLRESPAFLAALAEATALVPDGIDWKSNFEAEVKGLQARLANLIAASSWSKPSDFAHRPDFHDFHWCSRGPEASLLLQLRNSAPFQYGSDAAFRFNVLLRVGHPLHPGRTKCMLCDRPADSSGVHDLCCTEASKRHNRNAQRHKNIQEDWKSQARLLKTVGVTLAAAQPEYRTFLQLRDANAPPSRIVKADVGVSILWEPATIDTNIAVDFTVAGLNRAQTQGLATSSHTLTEAAENRKLEELKRTYIVNLQDESFFVPFAIDIAGSFGPRANALLRRILPPPGFVEADPPPLELPPGTRDEDRFRNNIWTMKASMVSTLWSSNASILSQYTSALNAKKALLEARGEEVPVEPKLPSRLFNVP